MTPYSPFCLSVFVVTALASVGEILYAYSTEGCAAWSALAQPGCHTLSTRPSPSWTASVRLPLASTEATATPRTGSYVVVAAWPRALVTVVEVGMPVAGA